MKRTVLKYGAIAGGVIAGLMAILLPLTFNGPLDVSNGRLLGYSAMIVSFLAVFFGIRAYRDDQGGGAITFGTAFMVGILISLIGCAAYVAVWEITYWGFFPDFGEKYAAAMLERMRAEGKPAAEIAEMQQKMTQFAALYRNPLFNVAITFVEVFPVGLIMTLVSAAILRTPAQQQSAAA